MSNFPAGSPSSLKVKCLENKIEALKKCVKALSVQRDLWHQKARESDGAKLRYRAIFENTGTATILIDSDLTISACNLKFSQLVKLAPSEIEGRIKWPRFIHPHDLAAMKKYHKDRRIQHEDAPKCYEFRLISQNGDIHNILITIDMIPGSDQSVASLMDITDRLKAENALKTSEEKYRLLVETMNDGLAIQDPNGILTYVNSRACAMLGYMKSEMVGCRAARFVAKDSIEAWNKQVARRKKGDQKPYEIIWVNKDGRRIYTIVSPRALFDENKCYSGSFAILTDITDYKRAAKALRLSEEMFSKAFRASPSSTFIATLVDQKIINVNDSFVKNTGYGLFEVIGKSISQIKLFAEHSLVQQVVAGLSQKGHLRQIEVNFLTKDGKSRKGIMSAERIQLWQESCILASIEDVTESRQLQRQIMQVSARERHRIGRDLHDDLCPHLIGIEALSNVLLKQFESNKAQSVDLIKKIQALIQEAIDKTRHLSHGLCPENLLDQGLTASIEHLAGEIRSVHGLACRFIATTNFTICEDDEDDSIAHIYHIVQEATLNAVKHANCRNIDILLENIDRYPVLRVKDDGCGISKNKYSNGMGLSLIKYRAKVIGAKLDIISMENQGTEIRLQLKSKSPPNETKK